MPRDKFWSEELTDLRSKLKLLVIVFGLVVLPAAILAWLGVPLLFLKGLVIAGSAILGLVWLTVRLWDDLHWGPLLDLEPFATKESEKRSRVASPETTRPSSEVVIDSNTVAGATVQRIERIGGVAANVFRVHEGGKSVPRARVG